MKKAVSPMSAGFAHKIGCHDNVYWPIRKPIPDWTSTPTCLPSLKIWWTWRSVWQFPRSLCFAPSDR